MKLRNKLLQITKNRYGYDELTRFLLVVIFCFYCPSLLFQLPLLNFLCLCAIFYVYFRIFSRNIYKRSAENRRYLKYRNNIKKSLLFFQKRRSQSKYYCFFKCPKCKQKIRIPRGHGKVEIKCPKCNHKFIQKT